MGAGNSNQRTDGSAPPPYSELDTHQNQNQQQQQQQQQQQPQKNSRVWQICARCHRTYLDAHIKPNSNPPRADWEACNRYHTGTVMKLGDYLQKTLAPGAELDMNRLVTGDLDTMVWGCCTMPYVHGSGLMSSWYMLPDSPAAQVANKKLRGCRYSDDQHSSIKDPNMVHRWPQGKE